VAVLGHELRNPLAAALTGVSLVREMVDPGDPREEILSRAVADLERVGRLVASFLDFSRARDPRRQQVDFGDVAQAVVDRKGPNVALCRRAAARTAGDPMLLERVLENLVENALAMGASRVDVECFATDGEVHVDVVDDGPGVPTALRDEIFEPSVSGRGSSGLGLAIAADVIAAHGGRISLRPTVQGATFRVTLPCWKTAPVGPEARCEHPVG